MTEPGWRQLWGCQYLGDGLIAPCWQGALPHNLPQMKRKSFPQHFYPLQFCKNGPCGRAGAWGGTMRLPGCVFTRLVARARGFGGQIVFILGREPMCDVCACALLPVFRAEEDMFGPSPLPATCASLSAGALRKGKAALAKLGEKKTTTKNRGFFLACKHYLWLFIPSSMAIYALSPLPGGGYSWI